MKQLKLTITLTLLSLLTFIVGCTEEKIGLDSSDEVTVNLRLDEALMEKAYVRFLHNGSREDYWYYMCTEDLETDAELLLNAHIADVLESEGELLGNVGVNKSIMLTGLSPKTDYRVIAARISHTGEIVGNVAELNFVTKRDPDVFEVYPAWEITYKERKLEGDVENEIFSCKVSDKDSKETYIPCLISESDFKNGYKSDLRTCFEDYTAYLAYENVKWASKATDVDSEFVQDRLMSGNYILFMIGVTTEGELTGYYSRTDFPLAQEPATEAYDAWVGRWELSGKYQGIDIAYEVEISPEENNLYYRMYGWEAISIDSIFEFLPEEMPLKLYFEKATGAVYVISEELPDMNSVALADFYNFYLFGAIDYNGNPMYVDIPNLRLAKFSFITDDYATAASEKFRFDDGSGEIVEYTFLHFNYLYTSLINSHMSYNPATVDSKVPSIQSMSLRRL